jgi:hypothetical protein
MEILAIICIIVYFFWRHENKAPDKGMNQQPAKTNSYSKTGLFCRALLVAILLTDWQKIARQNRKGY